MASALLPHLPAPWYRLRCVRAACSACWVREQRNVAYQWTTDMRRNSARLVEGAIHQQRTTILEAAEPFASVRTLHSGYIPRQGRSYPIMAR
eukprot:1089883-Rhodomonas_salina.4